MTVLIDPPNAAGHGRLWSHLASDTSLDELHAFVAPLRLPHKAFDGDHYDIPAEWYDELVAAGARPVSSRELVSRLRTAGLRSRKAERLRPRPAGAGLVRPPALGPGSRVAVVLPAGRVDPERLATGTAVLRGWGMTVLDPVDAEGDFGWLAGGDEARAAALTDAWESADAVWAGRGGFGSARLLDLLDWGRLVAAGPRLLVGFSDVTTLHQAFAQRLGIATLHAPGVAGMGETTDADAAQVRATLAGQDAVLEVTGTGTRVPVTVPVTGPVVGGNVTVLAAGMGRDTVRPAAGSIALLEDVGEHPYRLDRALTQLVAGGWFAGVRAVVCGGFTDCGPPEVVRRLLDARLGPLGVPVAHGAPVGHGTRNLAVPLGTRAVLDGTTLRVTAPVRRPADPAPR